MTLSSLPRPDRAALLVLLVASWYFALEPIFLGDALLEAHGVTVAPEPARKFLMTWMVSFGSMVVAANATATLLFARFWSSGQRLYLGLVYLIYFAIAGCMLLSLVLQHLTGVLVHMNQAVIARDALSLVVLAAISGWRWRATERATK